MTKTDTKPTRKQAKRRNLWEFITESQHDERFGWQKLEHSRKLKKRKKSSNIVASAASQSSSSDAERHRRAAPPMQSSSSDAPIRAIPDNLSRPITTTITTITTQVGCHESRGWLGGGRVSMHGDLSDYHDSKKHFISMTRRRRSLCLALCETHQPSRGERVLPDSP